jgi:alpha-glucosidase
MTRTLRILPSFLASMFVMVAFARAEWQGVGAMTAQPPQGNQIVLTSRTATAAVTVLAPDAVRVRIARGAKLEPDYSWAVTKTTWPAADVKYSGDKQMRIIRTSEIEVHIQLSPFLVSFYDLGGKPIVEDARDAAWDGERVRAWKSMPADEHYYGLGEKTGPLDKRGRSFVNWNSDPAGYDALTDPMYQTVPFVIGLRAGKAYGIFFDNTYRSSFDFGVENPDRFTFGAEGGEMNYYFFYGPDPKKVIARYTELTGRTSMPPRWVMGYVQGSALYHPESKYRFVASNFRERRIPCDAIFFDTVHMDRNLSFTWDKAGYPNPAKLIADLRAQGFRTFEIVDPGLKVDETYDAYKTGAAGDHFVRRKDGRMYSAVIWPGISAFPDFTSEKARDWWGTLMAQDVRDGVGGFLTDMNEPTVNAVTNEQGWSPKPFDPDVIFDDHGLRTPLAKNHNVYGMLMSAATHDGYLKVKPNERPFIITRATYAGGQRYAAQWTGDNMATWENLRTSLRLVMSMGISGLPMVGSDTGGFVGYPSAELYTRWLEAGVFHPFFWTHTIDPDRPLDPWAFGIEYEAINRRIIELRYRLVPYLTNAFYQSTQTGLPIMRPLMLEFPYDTAVMDPTPAGDNHEFMFGDDLLVAPVVFEGQRRRKVYLPRGTWTDFWTEQRTAGPATITVDAPLDRVPIFARAGALIPMQQVVQHTGEAPINPLTLEIYPSGNSNFEYYEDDGETFDYLRGVFLKQKISVRASEAEVRIQIAAREGTYSPPARSMVLKIHGRDAAPRTVTLGGKALELQPSVEALNKTTEGAAFDAAAKILWLKFADSGGATEVRVSL